MRTRIARIFGARQGATNVAYLQVRKWGATKYCVKKTARLCEFCPSRSIKLFFFLRFDCSNNFIRNISKLIICICLRHVPVYNTQGSDKFLSCLLVIIFILANIWHSNTSDYLLTKYRTFREWPSRVSSPCSTNLRSILPAAVCDKARMLSACLRLIEPLSVTYWMIISSGVLAEFIVDTEFKLGIIILNTNIFIKIFKKVLTFIQDYCRMTMQDNSRMTFEKERTYG